MLRRPADRLEGLAELTALAEALGDAHLELQVMLRRAAAFRLADEDDRAADVARDVRDLAARRGDARAELAACLELGQDLVRSDLGEGFVPSAAEIDLDGPAEAFSRATELAEELGDDRAVAAASRELGTLCAARIRGWFVERVKSGEHIPYMVRVASGERLEDILPELPIAPDAQDAQRFFGRALELFEKLGDRRGAMSTVIAMAYLSYGPDVHMGVNPAQRIEEIRRLMTRYRSMSKESERGLAEAQMLFGVHVFARAKMIPDLAVSRGKDAYEAALTIADRAIEFAAAGGVAMSLLDLGDVQEAERWLDLAAATATSSPTPLRVRRLEMWRGLARAAAGDAAGMRAHMARALEGAGERGRAAARCEVLARLAVEAARLGAGTGDEELLPVAEQAAREAKEIVPLLPGHPPWGAQANAALAAVALARGDLDGAAEAARSVVQDLQSAMREDAYPEILIPTARAVMAAGSEAEKQMIGGYVRILVAMTAQRTRDEAVRVRWFRGPVGSELVKLVGPVQNVEGSANGSPLDLDVRGARLLGLLTEGLTNREIAERVGSTEEAVGLEMQEMFAMIGASSRGEATMLAIAGGVL
jgi:DNA-binding NarL/FixJ family response regulator